MINSFSNILFKLNLVLMGVFTINDKVMCTVVEGKDVDWENLATKENAISHGYTYELEDEV